MNSAEIFVRKAFAGLLAAPLGAGFPRRRLFGWRVMLRRTGVLVAAALVACADYQPKPLPLQSSAVQFAARRLDAPELRERIERALPAAITQWPPPQWDRAALLAVAIVANPKLAVARAQVSAAQVHESTIHEPANPQLSLQSEYARHDPHPWLYGFALNLSLRSPAIKAADIELASLGTRNAQWQLLDEVWATRRSLIAALSDWQSARQRLRILERLDNASERLIVIEQKRVAAGEDAPVELLVARQSRLAIGQQQTEARAAQVSAQAAIAAALGVLPMALDAIELVWPEWGAPPAIDVAQRQQLRETALLSRADLAAAIGDYAETENKLHQAVLRQYPQLQLSPGYYWDHGVAKFPFDIGFTLPGLNRSDIADAAAARDVSGARVLALQAQIYGDIETAQRSEASAQASLDAALLALRSTRQQAEHAQAGFRLGALGVEEDLAAQILVLRSELEIVALRAAWQADRNALEDALHTPLSGPELRFSNALASPTQG